MIARVMARLDAVLGEGPVWVAEENSVYCVDIKGHAVFAVEVDTGAVRRWAMPDAIGWLIPRRDAPGFLAGFRRGFAHLTLEPFSIRMIAELEPDRPDNRLNDAKADPFGRVWAGSMDNTQRQASGALYRIDPDGSFARVDDGYQVANGPAISPDGRLLYHADSARRVVSQFDVSPDGVLTDKRPFVTFPDEAGCPDGMTVDADGCVWVAHWDGFRVSKFSPGGAVLTSFALPVARPTSCCFGGEGLDRLFVTSAASPARGTFEGALFEIAPGVRGLPTQRFAG